MAPMPKELTPEQRAVAEKRRLAKLEKKAQRAKEGPSEEEVREVERGRYLQREWVALRGVDRAEGQKGLRVVSWNLLAQALVRRELFPGSDCLKWPDRRPMLAAEMRGYADVDIICLQECDRLRDLLPSLPNHAHITVRGPNKQHGLVILYQTPRLSLRAQKSVQLDLEELHPLVDDEDAGGWVRAGEEKGGVGARKRRGGSRLTGNVGLMCALEEEGAEGRKGVIVGTTHLFWHPKFPYERLRQSILLMRALLAFRAEHGLDDWPIILSGDLNTEPDEATYQLITAPHAPLPAKMVDNLEASRLVHVSVDRIGVQPLRKGGLASQLATASLGEQNSGSAEASSGAATPTTDDTGTPAEAEEEQDKEEDADEKSLRGTRPPEESDGILAVDDLVRMAREVFGRGGRSGYDHADDATGSGGPLWLEESKGEAEGASQRPFGGRGGFKRIDGAQTGDGGRLRGWAEPGYTCYSPLFHLTLDYIFCFPPSSTGLTEAGLSVSVNGEGEDLGPKARRVLRPAMVAELGQGLPRKGVCASDHLAVGVEWEWR